MMQLISRLNCNSITSRYLTVNASTLGADIHNISLTRTGYSTSEIGGINVTVEACVGIDVSEENIDFSVNLSQGIFVVNISNIDKSDIILDVYNSQGKKVYSELIQTKQEDISKQIDIESLSAGIYFIKIQQGNLTKTQKNVIR
jgi:hypothetical protein